MKSEIEVCKTCNDTGIEYDGAGHTCTTCNGIAASVGERKPVAYKVNYHLTEALESAEAFAKNYGIPLGEIRSLFYAPPELADLQALSVTNIMLDIVPGDGSGHEVYAKSVAEVEAAITKRCDEIEELQAAIAQLQAQLQPRTVRDVVSFAYIEKMSVRQISDLLTKQYDEITMLRNVVKEVAEAFDGGPACPWIPGCNGKKIYNKVMLASVPLRSAQSDDPSE